MERAGSSAEGAGAGGGGFGTAGAGAVGLSTTPDNFPGMHAVRRSADGSGGGGEAAGEAETLSQVCAGPTSDSCSVAATAFVHAM